MVVQIDYWHRKLCNIDELLRESVVKRLQEIEVVKSMEITAEEYDEFVSNFFASNEKIVETNGLITKNGWGRTSDDGLGLLQGVLFWCVGKEWAVVVDSQGYDYARYTAVVPTSEILAKDVADEGLTKTVQAVIDCLMKQKDCSSIELAEMIANPTIIENAIVLAPNASVDELTNFCCNIFDLIN